MKRKAQLDREIAQAVGMAPRLSAHSAKALDTLLRMHTIPAQWQLTPIEWVDEEREIDGLVTCPTCRGRKFVRIADGVVLPPSRERDFEYDTQARKDAFAAGQRFGNCPTCARRQGGWGLIPQGKVKGKVRAMVKVGYPMFPPGTRFDSRFFGGLHCNLCNKLILKSGRVPVHAVGNDGVTHGMFVGEDCARKFLDVKIRRQPDSIMEG